MKVGEKFWRVVCRYGENKSCGKWNLERGYAARHPAAELRRVPGSGRHHLPDRRVRVVPRSRLAAAVLVWLIGGQLAAYFRRQGRLAVRRARKSNPRPT